MGASQNISDSRNDNWTILEKEGKKESQIIMFPDFEFVGINLAELLKTINKRIEKLLDKDHQIGHSYFMSVGGLDDLKVVFQNKIIPLLQEYFFGDFGKIGLVMGKGFVKQVETTKENVFADFGDPDGSEFSERITYMIENVHNMSDPDFITAINLLLKK